LLDNIHNIFNGDRPFKHILIVVGLSLLKKVVFLEFFEEKLGFFNGVIETKTHFLPLLLLEQRFCLPKLIPCTIELFLLFVNMGENHHAAICWIARY